MKSLLNIESKFKKDIIILINCVFFLFLYNKVNQYLEENDVN